MKKNIIAGGCRLDFEKCDYPEGQMSDPPCCGTCRYCGEKRIRMGMLQIHEEDCRKINPVPYGYIKYRSMTPEEEKAFVNEMMKLRKMVERSTRRWERVMTAEAKKMILPKDY